MGYNVLDLLTDLFNIHPVKASNTKGGEYHSPCPGCGGDDRFIVWVAQNDGYGGYWCRQCSKADGKPKDNAQFLVEFKGMGYREAFRYVGRGKGWKGGSKELKAPNRQKMDWVPTEYAEPDELWQSKATEFTDQACEQLLKFKEAMKWLDSRGINTDTVQKYKLGWNSGNDGNDLYRSRKGWGLAEELKENDKPKSLWLPVGLVIPFFINGKIYRLRIRRTKEAAARFGPKYYIVPGSKSSTMILEPERKVFVVVEGELDALAVAKAAGDYVGAVAIGSLMAKPDAYVTQKLSSCLKILNALDFEIGQKAQNYSNDAIKWWERNFVNCKRWPVPIGKDPGEAIQLGVDLRSWIYEGLPPIMTINKQKSVKARLEKTSDSASPEVQELETLLSQNGVTIKKTHNELGIIEPYMLWRQKHWDIFSRISKLVFHTESVFEYIKNHPSTIINGENLIYDDVIV